MLATTGVPLETPEAPAAERSWLSVGAFSLVSFFWAGTLGLRSTRRKRSSLKVFVCRVGVPGEDPGVGTTAEAADVHPIGTPCNSVCSGDPLDRVSAMEFSSAELQEAADAAEFADSVDGRRRPSAPPGDAVPAPCAPSPDAAAIHAIPDHL